MDLFESQPMAPYNSFASGRVIFGDPGVARTGPVFFEWEMREGEFADQHPHDEFNFVLEGELHVECEGVVVVAGVGDLVRVPADRIGTYRAPVYARMFAAYGPNPEGRPTYVHAQSDLSPEVNETAAPQPAEPGP